MPSIKKTPLAFDKYLISESEAVDALIILDLGFKLFSYEDQYRLNIKIEVFKNTYHHSPFDTLEKIEKLLPTILEDIKQTSPIDVYHKFVTRFLSQFDKEPIRFFIGGRNQWIFKEVIYEVKGHYSDKQIRLLILEDFDKDRRYFEKLKTKFDENKTYEPNYSRPRIPESVRVEVWRRDGGKCARCGSREKLEYDHIVAISKGGSNTARNIELLCEKHNRSKSDNVV